MTVVKSPNYNESVWMGFISYLEGISGPNNVPRSYMEKSTLTVTKLSTNRQITGLLFRRQFDSCTRTSDIDAVLRLQDQGRAKCKDLIENLESGQLQSNVVRSKYVGMSSVAIGELFDYLRNVQGNRRVQYNRISKDEEEITVSLITF